MWLEELIQRMGTEPGLEAFSIFPLLLSELLLKIYCITLESEGFLSRFGWSYMTIQIPSYCFQKPMQNTSLSETDFFYYLLILPPIQSSIKRQNFTFWTSKFAFQKGPLLKSSFSKVPGYWTDGEAQTPLSVRPQHTALWIAPAGSWLHWLRVHLITVHFGFYLFPLFHIKLHKCRQRPFRQGHSLLPCLLFPLFTLLFQSLTEMPEHIR